MLTSVSMRMEVSGCKAEQLGSKGIGGVLLSRLADGRCLQEHLACDYRSEVSPRALQNLPCCDGFLESRLTEGVLACQGGSQRGMRDVSSAHFWTVHPEDGS